ncbi:MAG TPA: hypothetical protein VKB80_06120 [Kofleriaceae bacterium]|nr:hypothetical protein [Kofleriaceae bacterium]
MQARFALLLRLVLAWACCFALVAVPLGRHSVAWGQDDEDSEDDDDGGVKDDDPKDDGGQDDGDKDDEAGESRDKDGEGDLEGDDEDEDEGEKGDDKDEQPPVTEGGLYTKKNYPVGENLRPMTLIKGMFELKAGINMDLNALHAFETMRVPLEARFGLADHVELQGGVDFMVVKNQQDKDSYDRSGEPVLPSFDDVVLTLGLEAALYYNVVDFRVALEVPINPSADGGDPIDDPGFGDGLDPPSAVDAAIVVGVPFRLVPRKQFAIFALDKIFTVHTLSGSKPDLNVGVGVVIMPVDLVSIALRGEFLVPEFNTNFLLIPASATVQFSPSNKIDLGLEFTVASLKLSKADERQNDLDPSEDDDVNAFSRRFLQLFVQARF